MMAPTGDHCAAPIALFIFNRPHCTQEVFQSIRQAQPPILFIVSDGPRAEHPEDLELVQLSRSLTDLIDWPCTVYRNYSEINLGCKARLISGLDWIFQQVPAAIILEDDCLPHPDFFPFCGELLSKHQADTQVFSINGHVWEADFSHLVPSYHFSKYFSPWGWATWADRWFRVDTSGRNWNSVDDREWLEASTEGPLEFAYWKGTFDLAFDRTSPLGEAWDYAVQSEIWRLGELCIRPTRNLVHNIGIGPRATHTKAKYIAISARAAEALEWPLVHPISVAADQDLDEKISRIRFSEPFKNHLFRKI